MRLLNTLVSAGLVLASATAALAQDSLRIVTVNYPLQFLAERLVGDAATVEFPVPNGVDPSFWRPSIADISTIQSADLILLNGAGFATWVDRVSLPRSKVVNTTAALEDQFIVTESITHSHGDGGTHAHEGLASYTWLDPTLAMAQVDAIAAALTRKNVLPAQDLQDRLAALKTDLEALDTQTSARLDGLKDVPMIATHPRYHYFARRYGLSITSLEWDAGAMPTDDQLAELEKVAQDTGARVLIWEADPPSGAVDAVQKLGLQSVTFAPLAHPATTGAYLDTMSEAVQNLSDTASAPAGQ